MIKAWSYRHRVKKLDEVAGVDWWFSGVGVCVCVDVRHESTLV